MKNFRGALARPFVFVFKTHRKLTFKIVRLCLSTIISFALALTGLEIYTLYSGLDQLDQKLIDTKDRPPEDPEAGNAVNIMIMGVDNRDDANSDFALNDDPGAYNTDTNIIVHISSDRKIIDLVSIPRDSIVDIPECKTENGVSPARPASMVNSAFPIAMAADNSINTGASCAVKTVEQNTGIRINGYVVVSFDGFKVMVDALGGVDMCIKEEIFSPDAGNLHLMPGCQHLDGWHATQYARARKGLGLGDGSDLGRIERQQDLLIAIFKEVLKQNIITDLPKLFKFINTTIRQVKSTYSVTELAGLSSSLIHLKTKNIYFAAVPNEAYIYDPNRVQFKQPDADTLFKELRKDKKLTIEGVKNAGADEKKTDTNVDKKSTE